MIQAETTRKLVAPPPPSSSPKLYGDKTVVGLGEAETLADMDFETYSEAGYIFDVTEQKWTGFRKNLSGIGAVGAAAYAEHPSTEVISLAYNLKDGNGPKLWIPGLPFPLDLFKHLAEGKLIEAWNAGFEYWIWNIVCTKKYGFPELPLNQLRCAMAKGKSFGLPGALKNAAPIVGSLTEKMDEGTRLINKFSCPTNPTKKNPDLRTQIGLGNFADTVKFFEYNLVDIKVESETSERVPDLTPDEQELWLLDQKINQRGIYVDRESLEGCIAIIEATFDRLTAELSAITGGEVSSGSEVQKILEWISKNESDNGNPLEWLTELDAKTVSKALLQENLKSTTVRVLELRRKLALSSVLKVFSMKYRLTADNRLKDLFAYCGAERTGRFAGRGPQPQNLPSKGPYKKWDMEDVEEALEVIRRQDIDLFEAHFHDVPNLKVIGGCLRGLFTAAPGHDLICSDFSSIEAVVLAMVSGEQWRIDAFRNKEDIYALSASDITGTPLEEIKIHKMVHGEHHPLRSGVGKVAELGCLGRDTLVLTESGWKKIIDVYISDKIFDGVEFIPHSGVVNRGPKEVIELFGVSLTPDHKIWYGRDHWIESQILKDDKQTGYDCLGISQDLIKETGVKIPPPPSFKHAPIPPNGPVNVFDILNCGPRNRFVIYTQRGPLIVHNSGYGGGVGAWKKFGAEKHVGDDDTIKDFVKKWRSRNKNIVQFWYDVERAAINAVMNPGQGFNVGSAVTFGMVDKVLYCRLPSGRRLVYHDPMVSDDVTPWGSPCKKLSYMSWNNQKNHYGPRGWIRLRAWYGILVENIVQAIARDVLVYSMKNLEKNRYPIVLHVHDEIAAEVPEGFGSVEEFERIMSEMPIWAKDWPIRATGGWRGKRYRKD